MKLKIVLIFGIIIGILITALFGFGLKEIALKGMVSDISEYNCGQDDLCTSCIIESHMCSCGKHTCSCGNKTVDKEECSLF